MRKVIASLVCILMTLSFTSCDPILPDGNIGAECALNPLKVGQSTTIDIKYPETSDTAVKKWETPIITIISGNNVVSVSDLSVTGLKKGQATLKIDVVADCAFMGITIDKPMFSTHITVVVE